VGAGSGAEGVHEQVAAHRQTVPRLQIVVASAMPSAIFAWFLARALQPVQPLILSQTKYPTKISDF
jgi:hypothetical protein